VADAVSGAAEPAPAPGSGPAPQEEAVLVARRRAEEKVPRHRFGVAYLALAVLLGAAVGLFVVLVGDGGKDGGPSWSAWKPTESGVKGLNQIAQHVSNQYALPSGRRIVGAYSTPPVVSLQGQLAIARAVAISSGLRGETANDSQILDAGSFWAYELCGFGKDCAIEGTASVARGRLLQRETLELALYTFKYERSIDYVITYFPPAGSAEPAAVLLKRDDLKTPLDRPLAATLPPPRRKLIPGRLSGADLAAIRRYIPGAYTYSSTTLQDGSPVLVLNPPAA
jgi:hypothetical protein